MIQDKKMSDINIINISIKQNALKNSAVKNIKSQNKRVKKITKLEKEKDYDKDNDNSLILSDDNESDTPEAFNDIYEYSVGSDISLKNYINKVNSFAMLTHDVEIDLCDKFYNKGDIEAGNQIFLSHLRLVVKMAFSFKKYFDNIQELIGEGNIGLLKALKKFDVTKKVRFATYAMLWIKASMQEYVFKNKSIVPIATNNNQKNVIYNLSKVVNDNRNKKQEITEVQTKSGFDIAISKNNMQNDIEKTFQSKSNNVEITHNRYKYNDISIDESFESVYTNSSNNLSDSIETPQENFARKSNASLLSGSLANAIKNLYDRAKELIKYRFLSDEKLTLSEISKILKISVERVRQIEESSLQKMKETLSNLAGS